MRYDNINTLLRIMKGNVTFFGVLLAYVAMFPLGSIMAISAQHLLVLFGFAPLVMVVLVWLSTREYKSVNARKMAIRYAQWRKKSV